MPMISTIEAEHVHAITSAHPQLAGDNRGIKVFRWADPAGEMLTLSPALENQLAGASKTRSINSARSGESVTNASLLAGMRSFPRLQFLEVIVEPIETLLRKPDG